MGDVFVGNDVVDLEEPRTQGRAHDDRFVERVYDEDEREAIRAASDGDLELWTRWAAKEAGFKVVSKLIGTPPPFVHRAFKVAWTTSCDPPACDGDVVREGRLTYGEHEARLTVDFRPGRVHAVGVGARGGPPAGTEPRPRVELLAAPDAPWAGPLEELEKRFTDRERDAVYSRASAAVRLGARADLAKALAVDESRLEIVCDPGPTSQRPPRVLLDGERTAADVSLSHDGRLIAWVLWLDQHQQPPEET